MTFSNRRLIVLNENELFDDADRMSKTKTRTECCVVSPRYKLLCNFNRQQLVFPTSLFLFLSLAK